MVSGTLECVFIFTSFVSPSNLSGCKVHFAFILEAVECKSERLHYLSKVSELESRTTRIPV